MRQGCTVDSNWLIAYTNHMYILSLRKILGKTDCKGLFLFISSVQLLHQTAEPRIQLRIRGDGAQYHQVSKLVRVGNSIIGFLIESTVFVIERSTRSIRSRSIFLKIEKIWRSKDRIPNPETSNANVAEWQHRGPHNAWDRVRIPSLIHLIPFINNTVWTPCHIYHSVWLCRLIHVHNNPQVYGEHEGAGGAAGG